MTFRYDVRNVYWNTPFNRSVTDQNKARSNDKVYFMNSVEN